MLYILRLDISKYRRAPESPDCGWARLGVPDWYEEDHVRLMNVSGRAALVRDTNAGDVWTLSGGRFGPELDAIFPEWDRFLQWAEDVAIGEAGEPGVCAFEPEQIGTPVSSPRQVFAIGMNYLSHALEGNMPIPTMPVVFTKFPSCIAGPYGQLSLPSEFVDWETELVVVVGREATNVTEPVAWDYVAGVTAGQDISERKVQSREPVPQFNLGKSFPGFGLLGPCLVSVNELDARDDIHLKCWLNGEQVQQGSTSDLIFTVPELITYLSSIVTLFPGDLIFTGTPSGVGVVRTPPRYLAPGDILETEVAGVGKMRHPCIASDRREHTFDPDRRLGRQK
jgi:2,4-diketo-3-deoxy-L-fuconate hydrolase